MKNVINLNLIDNYIENNNLTKEQFCKICNISPNILKQIYTCDYDFDIVNLVKIAKILNIEMYQIFND